MSSINEIEETIFVNSGFRGRIIRLMLWTDTLKETGHPIPSTIDVLFPTTMSLQIITDIITGIDKKFPVLAIIDGCQFYKINKTIEFAKKPCEGCE